MLDWFGVMIRSAIAFIQKTHQALREAEVARFEYLRLVPCDIDTRGLNPISKIYRNPDIEHATNVCSQTDQAGSNFQSDLS
jgi:hypothetical protein